MKKVKSVKKVSSDFDFMIGKKYFFRTVTYHWCGMVTEIVGKKFAKIAEASWVADSGRFMDAIKDGVLKEVEPVFSETYVNLDTCTDIIEWNHALPKEQIG